MCAKYTVRPQAVYRAALLPHPTSDKLQSLEAYCQASWLPLLTFVASHVVNPRAACRQTFRSWEFLSLATVLGVGCTAAYWLTKGCLWAPVLVHWLVQNVWICALGGAYRIRLAPSKKQHD